MGKTIRETVMAPLDLTGARTFGDMKRRFRQMITPKKKPYKGSKAAKKASRRKP